MTDATNNADDDGAPTTLAAALEREHRQIDGGIEAYIAAGGGDSAPLQDAMDGLRRHIYLEEEFLFPPLREAGMMMPIMVMLREHGALWQAMDGLDRLLADSAEEASVIGACRKLLSLLDAHNSKEEPVIYTQADDVLNAEATDELRDFLATGTTSDGWVSTAAR